MIATLPARLLTPRPGVDILIDRFGATAVLWATVRALLRPRRRRPRPPDPYLLSPHLRRDIGIPPEPPFVSRYFELR